MGLKEREVMASAQLCPGGDADFLFQATRET